MTGGQSAEQGCFPSVCLVQCRARKLFFSACYRQYLEPRTTPLLAPGHSLRPPLRADLFLWGLFPSWERVETPSSHLSGPPHSEVTGFPSLFLLRCQPLCTPFSPTFRFSLLLPLLWEQLCKMKQNGTPELWCDFQKPSSRVIRAGTQKVSDGPESAATVPSGSGTPRGLRAQWIGAVCLLLSGLDSFLSFSIRNLHITAERLNFSKTFSTLCRFTLYSPQFSFSTEKNYVSGTTMM